MAKVARVARRVLLRLALVGLGLVLLAALLLALAPVRGRLLGLGVRIADRYLTGDLSVGETDWPAAGHIVLRDLVWLTDAGDTLAAVPVLGVTVDLGALRHHDLRVDSLRVVGTLVDVPRLATAFAAPSPDSAATRDSTGGTAVPYLREGALPGVPSFALASLDLRLARLRVTPELALTGIRAAGHADAGHGRTMVTVGLRAGGNARQGGEAPTFALVQDLVLAAHFDPLSREVAVDTLRVTAVAGPENRRQELTTAGPVALNLAGAGRLDPADDFRFDVDFRGSLAAPLADLLGEAWPEALPAQDHRRVAARFVLDAQGSPAEVIDGGLDLDLAGSDGLERGRLRLRAQVPPSRLRDLSVRLDTLDLATAGLVLAGRGELGDGDVELALRADVADPAPLLALAGLERDVDGPISVILEGGGRLDLATEDLPFALRFEGRLAAPLAALAGPAWPASLPPADYERLAAAFTVDGAGRTRGTIDGGLRLDLACTDGLARGRLDLRGAIDPADPRGLTVRLDTLDLAAAGLVLAGRGGLGEGDVELALRADVADPAPLLALVGLERDVDGPVSLFLEGGGRLDLAAEDLPFALRFEGRLAAPLAGSAGPVWPASLPPADYERLVAAFTVDGAGRTRGTIDGGLRLDLAGTDGLARGRLDLRGAIDPADPRGLTVRLDTLDLATAGLDLAGHGALADSTVEVALRLAARTPLPLLALAAPEFADVEAAVDLDLRVQGPRTAPTGRLDLAASYRDTHFAVAAVSLEVEGDGQALRAHLRSGRLLRDGAVTADTLACELAYTVGRDLPVELGAFLARGTSRAAFHLAAGADSVFTVRLDSLELGFANQQLRLAGPAIARIDTGAGIYALENFTLTGDPGRFDLTGTWYGEKVSLQAGLDLLLTEEMLDAIAPSAIWSRDGGVDLSVAGQVEMGGEPDASVFAGDLHAQLRPHRNRPRLGADLKFRLAAGDSSGLGVDLRLAANDTTLLNARGFWPGRMDVETGSWHVDEGRDLELVVPEQKLPLGRFESFLPPAIDAAGEVVLAADVRLPVGEKKDGAEVPRRGSLNGRLAARKLEFSLPNRSRAALSLDCGIAGTPLDPKLTGTIIVESGFIRIPELPQSLHPVEGGAALWSLAGTDTSAGALPDTVPALWSRRVDVEVPATPLPDMDLRIKLPGNLRLHGYGLDAELSGDVGVTRGQDAKGRPGPALRGEVLIDQGTFRFMNRVFEVRRGRVQFTGEVPADPVLDLVLDTDTSGYRINVTISGRSSDPVIDLTSQPDLNKIDIMAVLVAGRPLNDLDADQRGRVGEEDDAAQQMRENLAGLAMVFGTQGLQNSMTSTFGVDVIEFGSDSQGGSTLAAGKYINPQLLLKYNQSLEKSGTYFVTLEYMLSRAFRLVSTYGQGEESSGVEVKWTRRY